MPPCSASKQMRSACSSRTPLLAELRLGPAMRRQERLSRHTRISPDSSDIRGQVRCQVSTVVVWQAPTQVPRTVYLARQTSELTPDGCRGVMATPAEEELDRYGAVLVSLAQRQGLTGLRHGDPGTLVVDLEPAGRTWTWPASRSRRSPAGGRGDRRKGPTRPGLGGSPARRCEPPTPRETSRRAGGTRPGVGGPAGRPVDPGRGTRAFLGLPSTASSLPPTAGPTSAARSSSSAAAEASGSRPRPSPAPSGCGTRCCTNR